MPDATTTEAVGLLKRMRANEPGDPTGVPTSLLDLDTAHDCWAFIRTPRYQRAYRALIDANFYGVGGDCHPDQFTAEERGATIDRAIATLEAEHA